MRFDDLTKITVFGALVRAALGRGWAPPADLDPARLVPWLQAKKIDSLFFLYGSRSYPPQIIYDRIWSAQRAALLEILRGLEAEGVSAVVLKGAEAIERFYGSRAISVSSDIDLLVPRAAAQIAKRCLFSLGYRQAGFLPEEDRLVDLDIEDIAATEFGHYELAPFMKPMGIEVADADLPAIRRSGACVMYETAQGLPRFFVNVDIHVGLSRDTDPAPLIERAVPSAFGLGRALAPVDAAWFTLARLYAEQASHAKTTIRDYFYCLPHLRAGFPFDLLAERAAAEGVAVPLYYGLSLFEALAPGTVPASVIEALGLAGRRERRDYGWQLGRILDGPEPPPHLLTRHDGSHR
ncbi:nucleotidyltransferase family protein [Chelatococcus sp. SYSU_G07232]|uniref:Nucleotidyltransferase family protein n=1 Tax=Chelatococcus albus TaxID=3047466 RepID=A0ABT7AHG4_9HYPH|nr:nucleotidyltransferase family protein [Chelatococcus sp. SYSU_G07232]MDJ1158081.1 nucleotidyltransferase family protein [Chelatococcus sp. SYSU_G07232]